ncbi:MAG: DUF2652 domain-containing protein [Anaerolineales bacterium]
MGVFTCADTLVDFIESIYVAFRDRLVSIKHKTTCHVQRLHNIPSLDLKFFAHCGEFVVQNVANIRELVGSDVNLIHRLTKNHVSESTGWRAYILVTEATVHCRTGLNLEDVHVQMEEYEHLGEIKTFNIDLHKRYKEITESRQIMLNQDADTHRPRGLPHASLP